MGQWLSESLANSREFAPLGSELAVQCPPKKSFFRIFFKYFHIYNKMDDEMVSVMSGTDLIHLMYSNRAQIFIETGDRTNKII